VKSVIVAGKKRCGKSLLAVGIGLNIPDSGYFKPIRKKERDEDVALMKKIFGLSFSEEEICPTISEKKVTPKKIREAYSAVSKERGFMVIESDLFCGYREKLSAIHIAELLDAKILLLAEKTNEWQDEAAFLVSQIGDIIAGVVLNKGTEEDMEKALLGVIPYEESLSAIPVSQIVEEMGANLLAGDAGLSNMVENILVGAMTPEYASSYFASTQNKCVITGGDRTDLIMSALTSGTSCVILTGDIVPSPNVIQRAERRKIPLLLVPWDTLTSADRVDSLVPKIRAENKEMLSAIKEMTKPVVDKMLRM
jgi:hypothetical protein